MVAEVSDRLLHIKESLANIRTLMAGKSIDDLATQPFVRAALERFLEIISEASRHVPDEWKRSFGAEVPWHEVASFGNILRHVYESVDTRVLWSVYQRDLDPLERAVDAMLMAHPPMGGLS
jgi:uncharacterized protein with HEPN domain